MTNESNVEVDIKNLPDDLPPGIYTAKIENVIIEGVSIKIESQYVPDEKKDK